MAAQIESKLSPNEFSKRFGKVKHVVAYCNGYAAVYKIKQLIHNSQGEVEIIGKSLSSVDGSQVFQKSLHPGAVRLPFIISPFSKVKFGAGGGMHVLDRVTMIELENMATLTEEEYKEHSEVFKKRYILCVDNNDRSAVYRREQIESRAGHVKINGKSLTKEEIEEASKTADWPPSCISLVPLKIDRADGVKLLSNVLYEVTAEELKGVNNVFEPDG